MLKNYTSFILIFLIAVIFEFYAGGVLEGLDWVDSYIARPIVGLLLISFYYVNSKNINSRLRILTLLGLALYMLADILVSVKVIYGLVGYLVGHTVFIIIYAHHFNRANVLSFFTIFSITFASAVFFFLSPNLKDMTAPVAVYIVMLTLLALSAYCRRNKVSNQSWLLVFFGVVLLGASDSVLGLKLFYTEVPRLPSHIVILGTWYGGLLLLVTGLLKVDTFDKHQNPLNNR